jgi:predicted lipoprotein with Yx(FWY)xxD motif
MKKTTCFFLLLAVTATLIIAGCTQQQVQSPSPSTAGQAADTIRAASSTLGTILVDARGNTLYYFANDIPGSGASTCTAQCAVVWPVFSAGTIQVSSPLDAADFGTITRADGTNQTAYMGRPLYYFAGDAKPGDVNGEGFNSLWYVANVSGMMPVVTAIPTTVSTTTVSTTSSAGTGAMGGY